MAVSDGKLMLVLVADGRFLEVDLPDEGSFTIGRSAGADVFVDSPSLSPVHAVLRGDNGAWTLQDAGSDNGTFVNDASCADEPRAVRIGEPVRLGDVGGQLRWTALTELSTRLVQPAEFERRLRDEIDRCIRFDHTLAVIAIEVDEPAAMKHRDWKDYATAGLRAGDIVTQRSRRRIDVAVLECARAGAAEIAERMRFALSAQDIEAKVGVATYPDDVPSAENLLFAAQQAMESADHDVVVAHDGVRVMRVGDHELIVSEPSMIRLFGMIERVAAANFPVLISGELGTGKHEIALAIHELGPRAKAAFVSVDCSTMEASELEGELFGVAAGDGGLIARAHDGTLFIEEVADMPLDTQDRLQSVIAARSFNVRIVAATHRDLKAATGEGSFRTDLLQRLSVIALRVPALRDRPRTIPVLAARFASLAARRAERDDVRISDSAMAALQRYTWPGNLHELRDVVDAAVSSCSGTELLASDLAEEVRIARDVGEDGTPRSLPEQLRNLERTAIAHALARTGGSPTQAAALLGIPRATLTAKMRALGLA